MSKIITAISQPLYKDEIAEFLKKLKRKKGEFLFIKLHPRETTDGFYGFLRKTSWKNHFAVSRTVDLYRLLVSSDAVVSVVSTVISEAIILGIPVTNLKIKKIPEVIDYSKRDLTLLSSNPEELRKNIDKILYSEWEADKKEREVFISDYYFKVDGKSTERILNLALDMMKTGN